MRASGWRWGAVLVVGALLAACGGAPAAVTETAVPAAPAATKAAVTAGGSADGIVLAIGGESEDGYDPTLGWGRYGAPLFQSTLLRRDEQLNIVNDLATGYTVSDDKLTWTVTIRQGAQFSDGKPVTAEDVAYTYNTAAASAGLTDLTALEQATATGPYAVALKLKAPQSTFVNRLITLGIVPKHAHGPDYGQNPIGSGPYTMVSWEKGKQLVVEANPNYYGTVPPIKRLTFLFVADEADGAFLAAKAGQVHVASVPQSFATQTVPNMRLLDVQSVDNRGLMFPFVPNEGKTTDKGFPIGNNVTADKAIRQAVNFALDRQTLVEGVLEGFGAPAIGPVDGLAWFQPDSAIQDNNVAQAQQILSEGGWSDTNSDGVVEKNGQKAEFTIIYPASDATRQALALASADMIKQAGMEVNVEGKSWDEIEQLMHSNVVVFGWGSHDQTEMYNLYHSSMAGQGWYNTGYYANKTVDSSLDLALGATSEQEALVYWKAAQWDGANGFTTKGDAAWAWLVNLDHTYFVHACLDTGVQQIEPHGHGWPITANINQWQWTCS